MPEELGQMPPAVASDIAAKMKEAGFMKFEELKDVTAMAFKAGSEAALTHKTCEAPDCRHCELRRSIDAEGFKRGLDKGLKMGERKVAGTA